MCAKLGHCFAVQSWGTVINVCKAKALFCCAAVLLHDNPSRLHQFRTLIAYPCFTLRRRFGEKSTQKQMSKWLEKNMVQHTNFGSASSSLTRFFKVCALTVQHTAIIIASMQRVTVCIKWLYCLHFPLPHPFLQGLCAQCAAHGNDHC